MTDTITKGEGFSINAAALARAIYEMFEEEDRAILRYGMIPQQFVDMWERALAHKAEEVAKDLYVKRLGGPRPSTNIAGDDWKKNFISTCSHAIVLELYGIAPMVV